MFHILFNASQSLSRRVPTHMQKRSNSSASPVKLDILIFGRLPLLLNSAEHGIYHAHKSQILSASKSLKARNVFFLNFQHFSIKSS